MTINFAEWQSRKSNIITDIKSKLGENLLIVRSSSFDEDTDAGSNAGAFKSVLNVKIEEISQAVDDVFNSYKHLVADSQVLIQPMLTNVVRSGVAFSHDANSGAAYVCINWADSDDTEAVTAGKKGLKYCQISSTGKHVPPEHKQVFDLVREVYKITGGTPVDIEFAITESKGEYKNLVIASSSAYYCAQSRKYR